MINILLSIFMTHAFASAVCTEAAKPGPLEKNRGTIWAKGINADGQKALLVRSSLCTDTKCMTGVYLKCGSEKYVSVLERDYGHENLVVTQETSPFIKGWKNLRVATPEKTSANVNVTEDLVIDRLHDGNDVLSRERFFNQQQYRAEYQRSGLGSSGKLPGEYVFTGTKYEKFYTAEELQYLLRLVNLGDPQAAHILYYEVLRSSSNHPRYVEYRQVLNEVENLRKLFKAGFKVLPRNMEPEYLKDAETRRYYVRANLSNIEPETIQKLLSEDASLASALVRYSADNLLFLPDEFAQNLRLIEEALGINRTAVRFVHDSFLKDKARIMSWCERFKITARYLDDSLLDDPEVAKSCIEARPINYQFFSSKIRANKKIAAKTFIRDGYMLSYAPQSIRSDIKLVKIALENYPEAKKHVDKKILRKLSSAEE